LPSARKAASNWSIEQAIHLGHVAVEPAGEFGFAHLGGSHCGVAGQFGFCERRQRGERPLGAGARHWDIAVKIVAPQVLVGQSVLQDAVGDHQDLARHREDGSPPASPRLHAVKERARPRLTDKSELMS